MDLAAETGAMETRVVVLEVLGRLGAKSPLLYRETEELAGREPFVRCSIGVQESATCIIRHTRYKTIAFAAHKSDHQRF